MAEVEEDVAVEAEDGETMADAWGISAMGVAEIQAVEMPLVETASALVKVVVGRLQRHR